jgi:RNA polymerase sigma-70 factor (ECF subfamily)
MPFRYEVDDAQLLNRAQAGEVEAFGALYERHAKAIYRFLFARLNHHLDAEDLTEEVFLHFWRSLPKYRQQGIPLLAYLFRIASNALIDHYRRTQKSERNLSLHDDYTTYLLNRENLDGVDQIDFQIIRQALDQLRDDYRDVLLLRFFGELSPAETAKVMDRSEGAVRVLQFRALAVMRKLLDQSLSERDERAAD